MVTVSIIKVGDGTLLLFFFSNNMKDISPKQIAIYTGIINSLICFSVVAFSIFTESSLSKAFNLIFLPILIFVVSYFCIEFMIEKFLSQRIKVIYKNITEIRRTETKPLVDDNKSLDDAEQDVQAWAESKDKKIASLQELADYRRNYIGNVSHEMKTPIFNVQGYIHTLLDGAINDAEVNMTFLTKASRNVERLQHIVEDLETIAKLETGKMVLDLQTFDLYQLAAEVFEELEIKALNKQAKLGFKNDMAKSFFVRADKEYIRQVLNNLINNSIKYGKIGGNTKIGFYDMDKVILTEVSDNGIGIAPQHLKHLFDRFYRVDRNRSRDVGETGLGLSIVKHILEAHNQSVHVRSTENVGTTFSFTLEKAEVPVAKKQF